MDFGLLILNSSRGVTKNINSFYKVLIRIEVKNDNINRLSSSLSLID